MELLSAKEAAKELNISQGTLHRFCRERKIRYTSLNRKEKFYTNSYQKTSEVEEFRSAEIGDRHESLIVPDWKEE
jgi:predicted site-specific integrase-resolvase